MSLETHDADPLVIRRLEFLGGMATADGWRPEPDLPEIAFGGRSNVGKSSLINRLLRRKSLARVSQHPGKTAEINFYRVNEEFLLTDLPGYGYARVSKEMRSRWATLIEGYLRTSTKLRGIVQLIDARHPPSDSDHEMFAFLADIGLPTIVALTKADKLKLSDLPKCVAGAARDLGLDQEQLIPFSAITGTGRDDLAEAIVALLAQPSWRI